MSSEPQYITTPVGRLVSGSADTANVVKDDNGQPKLDSAGQQQHEYYLAIAIPKDGSGQHWAHTDWGAVLWSVGHTSFPGGQAQRPDFAWKVIDGDSQVPNKRGVKPCDRVGFPGHWVLSFKTSFACQLKNADGSQTIAGTEFYRGCYVQVYASVKGNDSNVSPGIYLNQSIIALAGHGERINTGPDATAVGFGQGAAPVGMSQVPLAQNPAANVAGAQPPAGHPAQAMPPQGQPQPAPAAPPPQAGQAAPAPAAAPQPGAAQAPQQPYPQVMTPPQPPQG